MLPRYLAEVAKWKEEDCVIIGYSRKSVLHSVGVEERVKCLQAMVDLLHDRSLADNMFVSPSSQSTEPIAFRDMKDNTSLMARLKNVADDAQGS